MNNELDHLPERLLGVWAHPDDEAYLSAGLMARMADAGRPVTVVTATRGEKGTGDPARFDTPPFAEQREQELRDSLGVLGVHDVRILGYPDGGCEQADPEVAARAVASIIAEVRPDVVVTFGPDGITGHPDHQAVSRWTTRAWCEASLGELRYATMTHDYIAHYADLHDEIGAFDQFGLAGPHSVTRRDLVAEYVLSETELDRKRGALGRHGSQTEPLAAIMGEETYRSWWRTEWFRHPTAAELAPHRFTGPTSVVGEVAV